MSDWTELTLAELWTWLRVRLISLLLILGLIEYDDEEPERHDLATHTEAGTLDMTTDDTGHCLICRRRTGALP